ncbi:MAG: DUF4236 domain-containing protein [Acidobacteria bacterium]|nr:DUF4236 domain-containing protein [Acidobacteriota bacterium]
MGFFIRKRLGSFGPIRFNLSKSGIGVSAGVRGARIGVGPRGAYISGGAKGLYFYEQLGKSKPKSVSPAAVSSENTDTLKTKPTAMSPPKAGSPAWNIMFGLVGILILLNEGWLIGGILTIYSAVAMARKFMRARRFSRHDALLKALRSSPDRSHLRRIQESCASIKASQWQSRHQFIYGEIFQSALEDGIDESERQWLSEVSAVLSIGNREHIHAEILRPILWQIMADSAVTEEEERLVAELLDSASISREAIPEEWDALQQFIRARKIEAGELPALEAGINLQRNEVCHHMTRGAFLDKKTIRSYTHLGQKYKEEGLVESKSGDIYVTSKRILMVADGTSSIPHEKVLDVEIDHDEKLITLVKDGRQKPVYIKVPDAIYTGKLIEILSGSEEAGEMTNGS